MLYNELKRMIFNIPTLIIILTAVVISLLLSYVTIHRYSKDNEKIDEYYKEYLAELEGEVTDEKENYINNEKRFIDETISKEDEMWNQFHGNEIDGDVYQQYLDANFYATEHSASIEKIDTQYKLLLRLKENGISAHFIYDTYWNFYFDMRITTFVQMIVIIILVVNYLSSDYISGMWKMTHTYYNGRTRLFHIRMTAVLLFCAGVSMLFTVINYIVFQTILFMPDMEAPIQSLGQFENFPVQISISIFLLMISVFRLIALCLLGAFVFAVTSIVQNAMASFAICGGITLIPLLFSVSSPMFLKISFFEMLLGNGIMSRSISIREIVFGGIYFILSGFCVYGIAVLKQSDLRNKLISFQKKLISFQKKP